MAMVTKHDGEIQDISRMGDGEGCGVPQHKKDTFFSLRSWGMFFSPLTPYRICPSTVACGQKTNLYKLTSMKIGKLFLFTCVSLRRRLLEKISVFQLDMKRNLILKYCQLASCGNLGVVTIMSPRWCCWAR